MNRIRHFCTHVVVALRPRVADRGDVPGWVLVTVMTAGLVAALWLLADSQLKTVLTDAISAVTR